MRRQAAIAIARRCSRLSLPTHPYFARLQRAWRFRVLGLALLCSNSLFWMVWGTSGMDYCGFAAFGILVKGIFRLMQIQAPHTAEFRELEEALQNFELGRCKVIFPTSLAYQWPQTYLVPTNHVH